MEALEILKYTLPALIVFLTSVFVLREMIKRDQAKNKFEVLMQNQKTITPVRLQAYERLVLFLERITPDSLILRASKPEMNALQLHQAILLAIRAEYEHNMSQQVYITPRAWEIVKNARSGVSKLINTSFDAVKPDDPAIKLSKLILERSMQVEKHPTQIAIDFLKAEIGEII